MSDAPYPFNPDDLIHDPAYRMMVDEVATKRIEFAEYLAEQGDHEGARAELERAEAELEETPDIWEYLQLKALRDREHTVEEVEAIHEEAEQRRAGWLGQEDQ
jgi:uncharacterized protein (TIGR02996 family)